MHAFVVARCDHSNRDLTERDLILIIEFIDLLLNKRCEATPRSHGGRQRKSGREANAEDNLEQRGGHVAVAASQASTCQQYE